MLRTDYTIRTRWEARLRNQQEIRLQWNNEYTYLFDSFDPTRSDGQELPSASEYYYNSAQVQYQSDRRRIASLAASTSW